MRDDSGAGAVAAIAPGRRGLDWLNFFVANVQTGFGPFIAVYLTSEAWTQREIGEALSIGTLAAMLSQVPAGAAVDALHNKRLAAAAACLAIMASALLFALWPERLPVLAAEVLHGFASCMLSPAIAAISLVLVGRAALGERLGRNARYAAVGSGVAAAVLGACGTYVGEQAVFFLTAALMLPALLALRAVPMPAAAGRAPRGGDREAGRSGAPNNAPKGAQDGVGTALRQALRLFTDRRLLVFAGCVALFHLANAAVLPLAAGEMTKRAGSGASLVIAACIVLPQAIVAVLSPAVGRAADRWGRRVVLAAGFLALPLRAALLATVQAPVPLVLVQALDGVSAAAFGVLLPLVAADLTRGTNRFNLCMGVLGLAAGLGATLSTALAGRIADAQGVGTALLALAGAGVAAVLLVVAAMPETRLPPGRGEPT